MKTKMLTGIFLAVTTLSLQSFAAQIEVLKSVDVKAAIQIKVDSSTVRLSRATVDTSNSSLVNFEQTSGLIAKLRFHNSSESDWFMQFLSQADENVSLTLIKKGSGDMVDSYDIMATSLGEGNAQQMSVKIAV